MNDTYAVVNKSKHPAVGPTTLHHYDNTELKGGGGGGGHKGSRPVSPSPSSTATTAPPPTLAPRSPQPPSTADLYSTVKPKGRSLPARSVPIYDMAATGQQQQPRVEEDGAALANDHGGYELLPGE